jgi:hypothetical protein
VGVHLGHDGGQAEAEGQHAEHHPGDGDSDGLGGDQGAVPGRDENGRDDGPVPVLTVGSHDGQYQNGRAVHRLR